MDQYAVIGNPIAQSQSPLIHGLFAKQTQQSMQYRAIEAPIGGFAQTVNHLRSTGIRGLNITAPFKLDAFAYATELTPRARAAGAINCIRFDGAAIHGDNFDGIGLVRDIVDNLASPIAGKRVLLLGAGGAARGALLPLLDQMPAQLMVCNRNLDRAAEVAALAGRVSVSVCDYHTLPTIGAFDLIIHATSASLHGQILALPESIFKLSSLAYEMSYGKGKTTFLRQAQMAGAVQLADGVGMLVEQAAEAFCWWRGVRPLTKAVIDQLRVPLV